MCAVVRVAPFACCRAHVERLSKTTDGAYELSFPDRPPLVAGGVVLAVPAAVYFVWVVRGLQLGARRDWNDGARGAQLAAT